MADLDAPALNLDGTLKDASEIEWVHSPSAEKRLLPVDSGPGPGDSDGNESAGSAPPSKRLKGKEPARRVGGKRVSKPSDKASAAKGLRQLSPKTRRFFSSRFEGTCF